MSFVKWEIGLERKPEVGRMARRLGLTRYDVAGRLMVVWGWAYGLTKDGRVRNACNADVDETVTLSGFADAMAAEGWLCVTDNGLAFPKWGRHFRQVKQQQENNRERQRRYRERHKAVSNGVTDAPRNAPREEERREEKTREDNTPTPSKSPSPEPQTDPILDALVEPFEPAGQPKEPVLKGGLFGKGTPGIANDPCPHDPEVPLDCSVVPEDLLPVIQAWRHRGYVNPMELEQIGDRIKRYGLPMVRKALEIAIAANVAHMNYLDTVLRGGAKEVASNTWDKDKRTQELKDWIAKGHQPRGAE